MAAMAIEPVDRDHPEWLMAMEAMRRGRCGVPGRGGVMLNSASGDMSDMTAKLDREQIEEHDSRTRTRALEGPHAAEPPRSCSRGATSADRSSSVMPYDRPLTARLRSVGLSLEMR
jgi:hypothetical protein